MSFLRSSSDSVARSGSGSILAFLRGRAPSARVKLNFSLCPRPEQRALLGPRRRGLSLLDLVHERPQLARQLFGGLAGLALGVEVEERLVGIRQHLRPAALVEQLDPVGE